jgi:hypothetical protein
VYATKDIATYQQLYDEPLQYDLSKKLYIPTAFFIPRYEHDPCDALELCCKGTQSIVCSSDINNRFNSTWFPISYPSLDDIAPVLKAVYNLRKVNIDYVSRTTGKTNRLIAPHSLVQVGNFYYIRAFDHHSGDFRNFKLNRITSSVYHDFKVDTSMLVDADSEWNTMVTAKVDVRETGNAAEALRLDFKIPSGGLEITFRKALLMYVLMDWHIAHSERIDLPVDMFPLKTLSIQ